MSFNYLPFDQQDLLNGLPSFNNTLLLIQTVKNMPNYSLTCLDKRENYQKQGQQEDSLVLKMAKNKKIHNETPVSRRKKAGCTCTKTNCLKRYCECFSLGKVCGTDCGCNGCFNTTQHLQLVNQAKSQAKIKNSKKLGQGCICKKSQCQKKYCQCFNAGIACTQACKCKDCQNNFPCNSHEKQDKDKNVRQVIIKEQKIGSQLQHSYSQIDHIVGLSD